MKKKYWPILDIPEGKEGVYSIRHLHSEAGHEFKTATARTTVLAGQEPKPVKFNVPVRFHQLHSEEHGVWMTDEPVEQAQAQATLEGFYGDVLLGGLGLGYAAALLAQNPDVENITVVEIAPEVITLTAPHLPDDDGKITVVQADLFKYLKWQRDAEVVFDFAFYDIWQSDGEGTFFDTVCPLLALSEGVVVETPRCWNEDVMRGQLYFGLQQSIQFLTLPSAERKKFMSWPNGREITMDDLCTEQDTIWWDWKVPFWKWYRTQEHLGRHTHEAIEEGLLLYVRSYGHPYFATIWPPQDK
ncbi:hypothetical protein LCGC14_2712350 [marine sediment metagenome]|uniref:PABS domain-containing protein n=1 Tax=marine sediment metagenome TaxID=412755 RepID=A0A0F8ZCN0_9ZZZZ